MEGGYIMDLLISIIVGAVCASIVSFIFHHRTAVGTLTVDLSNPEKDFYDIHVDNLDILAKKKRLVLKVKTIMPTTQK